MRYSVCFFDRPAMQGHTILGNFKGIERDAKRLNVGRVIYEGGDMCPGGPARSLTLELRCGAMPRVLSIHEPSRCAYAGVMEHPGICSAVSGSGAGRAAAGVGGDESGSGHEGGASEPGAAAGSSSVDGLPPGESADMPQHYDASSHYRAEL